MEGSFYLELMSNEFPLTSVESKATFFSVGISAFKYKEFDWNARSQSVNSEKKSWIIKKIKNKFWNLSHCGAYWVPSENAKLETRAWHTTLMEGTGKKICLRDILQELFQIYA